MVLGKIIEADTPTIRLGATPSRLISDSPSSFPHFYAICRSCCNPANLSWLETGTVTVVLMSCDVDPYPACSVPEEPTVTCAGNTTQTQSTHISVLLLFVLHHLLVTRLYDYTLLQHIYETEFHPKYTQVNTTREDVRRTLRQLSKRLYKRQDGSSAQQSTVTVSYTHLTLPTIYSV